MIPVKAKQSQYVSGALGRWIAPVLSLALVLTGLMISQPARASEGADVVWSLGADCRVPLDGDGGSWSGGSRDWQPEWVEGYSVPVCSQSGDEPPTIVSHVLVEATPATGFYMDSLGVMEYQPAGLKLQSGATSTHPDISFTRQDSATNPGWVGNPILVDGAGSQHVALTPDVAGVPNSGNTRFLHSFIGLDSHGTPETNVVELTGGEEQDALPRQIPITWEPLEEMSSNQGAGGLELQRQGRAETVLTITRTASESGEDATFTVDLIVDVTANYYEGSQWLMFDSGPDLESDRVQVQSGQVVDLATRQTPAREGYTFKGWSTERNGAGLIYGPDDRYVVGDLSNSVDGVVLYGIWELNDEVVVSRYAKGWWLPAPAEDQPWSYVDSVRGSAGDLIQLSELGTVYFLYSNFFRFTGWSTQPDGGGIFYPSTALGAIDDFTLPPGTTNLYGQWTYQLPYFSNDAEFASDSSMVEISYPWSGTGVPGNWQNNSPVTVLDSQLIRAGYQFIEWNTNADGTGIAFQPGDTYLGGMHQNADGAWYWVGYGLWAQWAELFDVDYEFVDMNGNQVPADVQALIPSGTEVVDGATVTPAAPGTSDVAVDGGHWVFRGWDSGEVEIHADHTFVGTWEFVAAPVTGPSETPDPADPSIADPNAPSDGGSSGAGTPSVSTGGSIGQDAGLAGGAAFLIVGLAGLGWWRRVKVTK